MKGFKATLEIPNANRCATKAALSTSAFQNIQQSPCRRCRATILLRSSAHVLVQNNDIIGLLIRRACAAPTIQDVMVNFLVGRDCDKGLECKGRNGASTSITSHEQRGQVDVDGLGNRHWVKLWVGSKIQDQGATRLWTSTSSSGPLISFLEKVGHLGSRHGRCGKGSHI